MGCVRNKRNTRILFDEWYKGYSAYVVFDGQRNKVLAHVKREIFYKQMTNMF